MFARERTSTGKPLNLEDTCLLEVQIVLVFSHYYPPLFAASPVEVV